MFHVGQLVVCVDDADHGGSPDTAWEYPVSRGKTYEVRWAGQCEGQKCIRVVGVYREWLDGDTPLAAARFRPVDDSKLEIFRSMLTDKPLEVA